MALYLGDQTELENAAKVFHGWLGNRTAYTGFTYGDLSWQADAVNPVGVNPKGATKSGHNVDGVLPDDMRRGGAFAWPPPGGDGRMYSWEALQGALVQAQLLTRAGYAAFQWEDKALLRAVQFLYGQGWNPSGDDGWQPWLINQAYGATFPTDPSALPGKNIGWTQWTHALPGVIEPPPPPPPPPPDQKPDVAAAIAAVKAAQAALVDALTALGG